jgi:putative flippase GtrA
MRLRVGRSARSDAVMPNVALPDKQTQLRALRFLAVGGGSLGVQLAVMWVLKPRMDVTLAFAISWMISTTVHYFANRFWALPSTRHDAAKQFGEYLFTVALSCIINVAAFRLCLDVIGMNAMWATAWAVPPSTVVVFLLLNYRVFRAKT